VLRRIGGSAGLTLVVDVAIATVPALLGGPAVLCVKFVFVTVYARVDIQI